MNITSIGTSYTPIRRTKAQTQSFGIATTYACDKKMEWKIHFASRGRTWSPQMGRSEENSVKQIKSPNLLPDYTLGYYKGSFFLSKINLEMMDRAPKGIKIYDTGTSDLEKLLQRLNEFQDGNKKNFKLIKNQGDKYFSLYDEICELQSMDPGPFG